MYEIRLRIKLDKVLNNRNLTQLDLAKMIQERRNAIEAKTGEKAKVMRPASISEIYNNQRKSLNKELIEEIATVLKIEDISELMEFYNHQPLFDAQ